MELGGYVLCWLVGEIWICLVEWCVFYVVVVYVYVGYVWLWVVVGVIGLCGCIDMML